MPKGTNQKLKLIYLIKIMMEKTDEEHGITMPEILAALESYGVSAERKSTLDGVLFKRELYRKRMVNCVLHHPFLGLNYLFFAL